MSSLYSERWFAHPNADEESKKVQLYLDSFLQSGEIDKINTRTYKLNSKSIVTMEQYELDKRRHDDNIKLQWAMLCISILLVIIAIIQAGLVKCPVILDLENKTNNIYMPPDVNK